MQNRQGRGSIPRDGNIFLPLDCLDGCVSFLLVFGSVPWVRNSAVRVSVSWFLSSSARDWSFVLPGKGIGQEMRRMV